MKTKIGEKTSKPKNLKGYAKKYPGAVVLLALLVTAGVGTGVWQVVQNSDSLFVMDNKPAVVEEQETVSDKEDSKSEATEDEPKLEEAEEQNTEENQNIEVLSNTDNLTDILSHTNQPAMSLNSLKDSVEIREMVGDVQSGNDGQNTQQVAGVPEGSTEQPTEGGLTNAETVPVSTGNGGSTSSITASNQSLSSKAKEHKESVNDHTIGWIKVPNTNIDYPVVQYTDNDYYVYKDYNQNYSKDGVIYADYECNLNGGLATNNILYGHNWSNVYSRKVADPTDIMFGQLPSFHTLSFAQKTPFIYFSTLDKDYIWQVFAVFYTEESFNYISAYPSKDYYKTMLSEALQRSIHNYNVNVTTSDQILTLSTCTRVYGQRSDQRFVVMAKRVKEGTPSTTITSHPNFKAPQF